MKIKNTISVDINEEIKEYCRERDRLITSEDADDYLLIDSELNTTIKLDCHFWFKFNLKYIIFLNKKIQNLYLIIFFFFYLKQRKI